MAARHESSSSRKNGEEGKEKKKRVRVTVRTSVKEMYSEASERIR
jgi:hypothetical protein